MHGVVMHVADNICLECLKRLVSGRSPSLAREEPAVGCIR